ncbi:MAG: response regulator, partial [Lachnospiraceae bacterium]|nr:response regulator [Lachnospiraceae bacterium]
YDAEKNRILITDEIGRTELMAVIKEKNIKTFSVSNRNYVAIKNNDINTRSTAESNFPTWKLRIFEDYDGCLNSVVDETSDCILVSNYTKNLLDDTLSREELAAVSTGISLGVTFGISSGSLELYSIMSRIVNILPDTEINTALVEHSYAHNTVTFRDFLRDNFVAVLIIIGILFLIIITLLTQSILAASRERKAAEEAKAASYAKTSFLFNMSHDIRTPMNAIMGFRDLLEKNQEDPVLRAEYLKKIKESSGVLLSIINNVLEMARIEKGTITLNETAISTEQISDSLYSLFNEMMQRKNITFYRTIRYYHKYLYVDISKTREIFMNVLSNAYKYTEYGGVVRMDTTEIPSDKEGYANIKTVICDNGIGMDEDFLPNIFNEFSRERGVNSGKIEGTGLGMAIVKRLVDFLGGTVEVKSKKGEGTTFTIILPHKIADKADLDLLNPVEVDKEKFKGKTVLLAEDNDINAEIANEVLTDLGFEVERVGDGRLCVERFLDTPAKYDFILMDVQMPNMNGYEATKAIRDTEGFKTHRIPIIAMTANAFEEDRQAAFAAGMNGHVAKPIDVNELIKEIAKVLA